MQRLHRFLANKNLPAAQRAVKAIRNGVKLLALQPESGKPLPEMDETFREWLIEFGSTGYVVLYRYDSEMSVIVAVRHQKELGF